MQETWAGSLGWEDPLEEGMVTHFSILAWRNPWTEEPGRLQSMGLQRVILNLYLFLIYIFNEMSINPFPRERRHFQLSIYCLSNSVTTETLASAPSHLCHHKKYTFDLGLGSWHRAPKIHFKQRGARSIFCSHIWSLTLVPDTRASNTLGISWVMSVL